jgi:hypothetical protein
MRKQLDVDIKGSMNKDLAEVVKDLMEKYNALVQELEDSKADISAVDFAAQKISID